MKMTIVIDTDDPQGVTDAYKIARFMNAKHGSGRHGHTETYSKIGFIKVLRQYMKESLRHLNDADSDRVKSIDDLTNLRNAKLFADPIFTPSLNKP